MVGIQTVLGTERILVLKGEHGVGIECYGH